MNPRKLILLLLPLFLCVSCATSKILTDMYQKTQDRAKNFDIVIYFHNFPAYEKLTMFFIPTYVGLIDDTYRRYIVIKTNDKFILAHEIMHAFIFNNVHGKCLMQGGLYPIGKGCVWLGRGNWEEAMGNKWRNFSERPQIPEEYQPDKIAEFRKEAQGSAKTLVTETKNGKIKEVKAEQVIPIE